LQHVELPFVVRPVLYKVSKGIEPRMGIVLQEALVASALRIMKLHVPTPLCGRHESCTRRERYWISDLARNDFETASLKGAMGLDKQSRTLRRKAEEVTPDALFLIFYSHSF
jgi:hypothetical protein